MSSIIIYTDGACRGNPGPGGWGAVIYNIQSETVYEIGDRNNNTTNNRMELEAVIKTFEFLEKIPGDLHFHIDSTYVLNGSTKWMKMWSLNNWKTSEGNPVLNRDYWERLYHLYSARIKRSKMQWTHVFGHAGIPGNERADEIAQGFADKRELVLFEGPYQVYKHDLLFNSANMKKPIKKSSSSSSKKAYSYLSLVNGVLEKHKTWEECNARVKGVSGAKYKKTVSAEDEAEILRTWGL